MIAASSLVPSARAFDAIAEGFDGRFGAWGSVSAQRRAVRAQLARAFPPGSSLLELGGGTGLDAEWFMERGRSVLLTDPSPSMVRIAKSRLRPFNAPEPLVCAAEDLAQVSGIFDGVYSNFAALNCVEDLGALGSQLARRVRTGGRLMLVVFGVVVPGEWVTQLLRGRYKQMFRRITKRSVRARVSGNEFEIWYHSRRNLARSFAPWFSLAGMRGIGVFVPPSDAEPWITSHPRLLRAFENVDRLCASPLAMLGDHIMYEFVREP
jgi:ubiquinone/menaquinone biosynthesis C-methylase UbiE